MTDARRAANIRSASAGLVVLFGAIALVGCAPERGTLEGRVTYDGKPISDGYVMLFPTDGNYRHSSSVRIVEGRYRIEGIVPGERRVSLDNLGVHPGSAATPTPVAAGPDSYPTTITVEPGKHTLDFSLRSGRDEPQRRPLD